MTMTIRVVILAVLTSAMPCTAFAEASLPNTTATEASDARCLAVYAAMAAQKDEASQKGGQVGTMIFVGKLLGRHPAIDLEASMRTAAVSMGSDWTRDRQRCQSELSEIGRMMTGVGAALQRTP
jgi:hypothetical protein